MQQQAAEREAARARPPSEEEQRATAEGKPAGWSVSLWERYKREWREEAERQEAARQLDVERKRQEAIKAVTEEAARIVREASKNKTYAQAEAWIEASPLSESEKAYYLQDLRERRSEDWLYHRTRAFESIAQNAINSVLPKYGYDPSQVYRNIIRQEGGAPSEIPITDRVRDAMFKDIAALVEGSSFRGQLEREAAARQEEVSESLRQTMSRLEQQQQKEMVSDVMARIKAWLRDAGLTVYLIVDPMTAIEESGVKKAAKEMGVTPGLLPLTKYEQLVNLSFQKAKEYKAGWDAKIPAQIRYQIPELPPDDWWFDQIQTQLMKLKYTTGLGLEHDEESAIRAVQVVIDGRIRDSKLPKERGALKPKLYERTMSAVRTAWKILLSLTKPQVMSRPESELISASKASLFSILGRQKIQMELDDRYKLIENVKERVIMGMGYWRGSAEQKEDVIPAEKAMVKHIVDFIMQQNDLPPVPDLMVVADETFSAVVDYAAYLGEWAIQNMGQYRGLAAPTRESLSAEMLDRNVWPESRYEARRTP